MGIIYQHDKRSGITYAYESVSYWDREKKMSRAKRKLIGRVDPESGEIIPTDGRNRKPKKEEKEAVDYRKLYERLSKQCEAQKVLIEALKEENAILKEGR